MTKAAITMLGLFTLLSSGCSSDDGSSGGSGGSATGGGGSGGAALGGASGSGGASGGSAGDGAACKSCAQMVITAEADLSRACAGESATLVGAFVTCTCKPEVCGGPGKGCEAACTGGAIDAACIACDQTAGAGPCKTEFDACMADQ